MLSSILSVGIGGFFGAIFRYGSGIFINKYLHTSLPFATLFVNVLGSFIMGLLVALFMNIEVGQDIKLVLTTGFLGAFTTFSTFSIETFFLFSNHSTTLAILNILLNVTLSIISAIIGYKLVVSHF